jgi:Na+-translocating ferredoxin:NAD+ oxidoreductase subunit C
MNRHKFPGGAHPPDNKQRTSAKKTEDCPLPEELVIPLSQHIGAPAEACVKKGDRVFAGQVIGAAKGFISVPVHASTSGEVVAVEPRPHPSGRALPAIVLRPDGLDAPCPEGPPVHPDNLDPDALREIIRNAGIVGMGGAAFPTHVKVTPPPEKKIETLIINGAECEPYLTADHRLMVEEPGRIVDGAAILARILGVQKIVIGIEDNKPDALAALRQAGAGRGIDTVALPVKYPQGAERQLILALTGREVPSGGLPMDVGTVVHNVGTAAAVADAVLRGMPLISRIITVAGPGIVESKNLRVRVGTLMSHLVTQCGGLTGDPGKIIMGGPMMGAAQLSLDIPALRGTSGVLLFLAGDIPQQPERPCIRCGRCVRGCPARLLPTTIAAMTRLGHMDEAADLGAMDCIECGCCTYSCPAGIPLVQVIRQAKGAILAKRRNV